MKTCLLALTFGVVSVYARGRGGGGSGGINFSGGIDDNWDVPWYIKATLAFFIIWAIVSFIQFVLILSYIKSVPPIITVVSSSWNQPYQQSPSGKIRPRLPYILLAVITAFLTLAYILWSAYERSSTGTTVPEQTLYNLIDATNFFLYFNFPGHAAVLLWLTHQRAQLFHSQSQLQSPSAKLPKPFILSLWKRCLDWSLVVITYGLGLTWMAIYAAWNNLWSKENLSEAQDENYFNVVSGFGHAVAGMVMILALDVAITLIVLYVKERKSRYNDPIISRLLFICALFLFLFALEWLSIEIYQFTTATKNLSLNWGYVTFFQAVFEGICPVVITLGCILTMKLYGSRLPPSQQYAQGMGQYGGQLGWYGAGEIPRNSTSQSGGQPPSVTPYYPPSYYTGGYSSPPIPTPSPSMGIHERMEKAQVNQPFKVPGSD